MSDKTILVVDDDECVLFFVERALQHLGFSSECTLTCENAIERYVQRHESGSPFLAVITDISLPGGMGGEEFAEKLRSQYPETLVFVSSGHPDSPCMRNPQQYGFIGAIPKPVTLEILTTHFITVLEGKAGTP